MTQSKIFDKWAMLNSISKDSNTKWDHKNRNELDSFSYSVFANIGILPVASRLASHSIGMDLVSVSPMGTVTEEIKNEVKATNRERKIESIVDNKEFEEMKISDHPDYSGPKGKLMYLDFRYGGTSI